MLRWTLKRMGIAPVVVLTFGLIALPAIVRAQADPSISLRFTAPTSPAPMNVLDILRQAEQIRLMQAQRQAIDAQTQRIRQQMQLKQTEARMRELEEEKRRDDQAARDAARKAALASTNPTGPTTTGVLGNGRLWQLSTDAQRYAFLVGFIEALLVEHAEAGPRYFAKTLTIQELTKAIGIFYSQPENLAIPIPMALELVRMKANGERTEDIDEQTSVARRVAVQFMSSPPQ